MSRILEVEQKFPVGDFADVAKKLTDRGASWGEPIEQIDAYYAHPVRDFAATDEALRIRRVGPKNFVTYKGPRLDKETKTRREIELALAEGTPTGDGLAQLLLALGFAEVARVHKRRRPGHLQWGGEAIEIAQDEVQEVGTFLELEICTPEQHWQRAREVLQRLATELGLAATERRSYLELLLLSRGSGG